MRIDSEGEKERKMKTSLHELDSSPNVGRNLLLLMKMLNEAAENPPAPFLLSRSRHCTERKPISVIQHHIINVTLTLFAQ